MTGHILISPSGAASGTRRSLSAQAELTSNALGRLLRPLRYLALSCAILRLCSGNDFLSLVGNGVRKGRRHVILARKSLHGGLSTHVRARRVFTYVLLDEGMFFSDSRQNGTSKSQRIPHPALQETGANIAKDFFSYLARM